MRGYYVGAIRQRQQADGFLDSRVGHKRGGEKKSMEDCDFTDEETEFQRAVEAWKKRNRRRFPSLSELLGVLRKMGYTRAEGAEANPGRSEEGDRQRG